MYTNRIKKLSAFSLIVSLWLLCASSPAALVHYWSLDDATLADEGTGTYPYYPHAGQLIDFSTSYTAPTPTTGKFSGGYDFGSTNPLIYSDILIGGNNVNQSEVLDGTFPSPPVTLSMWFNCTQTPPAAGVWYLLGNYYNSNNQDRLYLSIGGNVDGEAGILFSVGETKDWNKSANPFAIPVSYNTWHHIMMTVQDLGAAGGYESRVTLVLDGGTPTVVTTTNGHSGPDLQYVFDRGNKRIATNGNSIETGKTFHGYIDDVAIFNELLPTSQATFMWNGGAGRPGNVGSGKSAYDPTPTDKSQASNVAQLKWYNAQRLTATMTNDVYISTNRADLVDPCNVPLFPAGSKIATAVAGSAGAQSTAAAAGLQPGTIYYWMVATKTTNPADGNNVNGYAGPVWKFENLSNTIPVVEAGPDKFTYVGQGTTTITGTVTDDGRPIGVTPTCTWKDSGGTPIATTVVPNGNTYTCTATVSVGAVDTVTTYTLEGNDTTGTGSDTMSVRVKATACLAAQSDPLYQKNVADINDDCRVNFKDFASLAVKWRVCTALDASCI